MANPPHADPKLEGDDATFKLVKNTLPVPAKDEVLVKVKYFSNDRKFNTELFILYYIV